MISQVRLYKNDFEKRGSHVKGLFCIDRTLCGAWNSPTWYIHTEVASDDRLWPPVICVERFVIGDNSQ